MIDHADPRARSTPEAATAQVGEHSSSASRERGDQLFDPRLGDAEDDASSTKQRSILAIAGSLLAEISLPKLMFAWTASILTPAVLLGLGPLAATAWLGTLSAKFLGLTGVGVGIAFVAVVAIGWFAWRPLFRTVEANFWALNALAVQPGYALCCEAIRHLSERTLSGRGAELGRLRAISCAGAGILLCAIGVLVAIAAWPYSQWIGRTADLATPLRLIVPTLANAVVIMSAYLTAVALLWGFADATMDQPCDLEAFDNAPSGRRVWRVAHLSDIHVVGERYGFRIESGRAGPRGNGRLERAMERLAALHAARPLDLVLVSGDMTDAGISAEWAEFLDILQAHPELAARTLILPGNHDLNIVDRANPARLDLPFSPVKTLRKMRALSAIAAIGARAVRVTTSAGASLGPTLAASLESRRSEIEDFADKAGYSRLSGRLARLWDESFPLIMPPQEEDGLGVALLNSNADANFSFTNALGMISAEQAQRLKAALDAHPRAGWILALHHHLVEYPMPVAAFSERIGTALINGSWFLRVLKPYARRIVAMHGHRHIDWIGTCGRLKIVSAPSPVMEGPDKPTHFYVHSLAVGSDASISLLQPERVDIDGAGAVRDVAGPPSRSAIRRVDG